MQKTRQLKPQTFLCPQQQVYNSHILMTQLLFLTLFLLLLTLLSVAPPYVTLSCVYFFPLPQLPTRLEDSLPTTLFRQNFHRKSLHRLWPIYALTHLGTDVHSQSGQVCPQEGGAHSINVATEEKGIPLEGHSGKGRHSQFNCVYCILVIVCMLIQQTFLKPSKERNG